jgi:hypothetical protein
MTSLRHCITHGSEDDANIATTQNNIALRLLAACAGAGPVVELGTVTVDVEVANYGVTELGPEVGVVVNNVRLPPKY